MTAFFHSLCVFLHLFPLILVVRVCQVFFTFAFVFVFVEEGKVCQQFFRLIRVVTVCRAALRYTQLRRNYHFVTLLFSSRYISIGSTRIWSKAYSLWALKTLFNFQRTKSCRVYQAPPSSASNGTCCQPVVIGSGRAEVLIKPLTLLQKCKTRISHNTDNMKRKAKPWGPKYRCDLDVEEKVIWNFSQANVMSTALKPLTQ